MPTGISGLYKNTYGAKVSQGETERKKITNFDRIKKMSVEEMAKEFAEVFFHTPVMEKPIIGYLESEVQEDDR